MNQIEKVKIPASVLSGLYKDVLISEPGQAQDAEKKLMRAVIVIAGDKNTIAADELLTGILTACKLNHSNAVTLHANASIKETVTSIKEKYKTNNILLFGIEPIEFGLPITFPHFQIQESDGIQYVSSPALETMLEDKSLKVKLWNSLKQIFL